MRGEGEGCGGVGEIWGGGKEGGGRGRQDNN